MSLKDSPTYQAFNLGDRCREGIEVAIEEVVVFVDELQVHCHNESELSQVDGISVEGKVGELPSGIEVLWADLLAEEEVDEAGVCLGELDEGELAVAIEIALRKEGNDDLVLIVLTLDDIFEVILVNDGAFAGADESGDVTAEGSRSWGCEEGEG